MSSPGARSDSPARAPGAFHLPVPEDRPGTGSRVDFGRPVVAAEIDR